MTCKDCLHIEVCAYIKHDLPICSDFADRSSYVVREKGEWIEFLDIAYDGSCNGSTYKCPKCSEIYSDVEGMNFCPNCGSDMRKEKNDGRL